MGKRSSTPEIGAMESARRAMVQRARKSLGNKKEKIPEMLIVSMVRTNSRRL